MPSSENLSKPTESSKPSKPLASDTASEKQMLDEKKERKWKIDNYVASTVALVVISLCALFVSIYQTRVLSQQQDVMSAQQEIMSAQQDIMIRNAKAQLWPNLEIGVILGYDGKTIEELGLEIANTGTGPAIIEGVTVEYNDEYAGSWWNMWSLAKLPDSIPRTISNSMINNRVIQAGERYSFLSLNDNQALMEFLRKEIGEQNGPIITICYRSVFDEYWSLRREIGSVDYDRAQLIEACTINDSIAFVN